MPIPFMSIVPRPHIFPSAISAPNGSFFQRAGSVGTTSMWLSSRMALPPVPFPFSRASRIERPGADS